MSSDVPVGLYRTFLSAGPIINLTIDGHPIGDTVPLPSPGTVEVRAWAESIFPIHTLEIIHNGHLIASTSADNGAGTRRLELTQKIKIDAHGWLAARCGAPDYHQPTIHHDGWSRGIFAHTSPIYMACGGDWHMHSPDTQYMHTLILRRPRFDAASLLSWKDASYAEED